MILGLAQRDFGEGLEEKRSFLTYRSVSNLATYKAYSDRNLLKCVNFSGFQMGDSECGIHSLLELD